MGIKARAAARSLAILVALSVGSAAFAQSAKSNKDIVVAYFRMMFEDRKVEEAIKQYIGVPFIQHDPYIADGADPVADYYLPYFEQHPQSSADIKRVIAEGDMVVVHSLWKDTPEDIGHAVVDMYRLRNGRIVEHWDVNQDVPENPANSNSMF